MCRLLAWKSARPDGVALATTLRAFRTLAATGRVPSGAPAGHRDGWGIAAFRDGAAVFYARSAAPADEDPTFAAAAAALEASAPDTVIAHLRKASAGAVDVGNAQPFLSDGLAFAHNGSIGARGSCDGPSDSLTLFREVLAARASGEDAFGALGSRAAVIRAAGDYRAMNFLLADGNRLRAWRDWNEATPDAAARGLDAYYGLFVGESEDGHAKAVSSEPLPGFVFAPIGNGESVDL